MAQLDGMQQNRGTPKTVEQLLHSDNPTSWNTYSVTGRLHDPEEDHLHHGKKFSVLSKVKEKAKKWRQTIVRRKNGHDGNTTPSWGVALEDYEIEEEPENLGSQANESQHATKISKENTKHFRGEPLITNKRVFSNDVQIHSDSEMRQKLPALKMNRTAPAMSKSLSDHQEGSTPLSGINQSPRALSLGSHSREAHPSPNKLTIDTQRKSDKQREKLSHPEETREVGSTDTEIFKEKEEQSSTEKGATEVVVDKSIASEDKEEPFSPKDVDEKEDRFHNSIETDTEDSETKNSVLEEQEELSPTTCKKTISEAVSEKLAPAYASFSEATHRITSKIQGLSISSLQGNGEERKLNRGVSVKEYFKNKLEPGEDERALSQVISEVISPKRSPTEKGVVEKVRAAVTLLLHTEEPSTSTSMKRSSSQIPVSTNAHEV